MTIIEKIESKMVASLTAKNRKAFTEWSQLVQAVGVASDGQKSKLLEALRNGNSRVAGSVLQRIVDAKMRADAQDEVTAMIADGNLTVAELERAL